MKLLIDAGNTRIKWAVVKNATEWLYQGVLPTTQSATLAQHIADQCDQSGSGLKGIQQIWVSNVAGQDIAQQVRNIGGKMTQICFVVASESLCGVHNNYDQTAQLGSDRWAALIAAWQLVQGKCLVVNTGTATTVDTLSEHGEFLGGIILPGVELMQRNLIAVTHIEFTKTATKLAEGKYAPFPLMSADAIYSGAIQASCGAIERQYNLMNDNNVSLILSGGAAGLLHPHLNQKLFKASPRVVDNLVLQGLLLIAQEANQP